MMRRAILSVSKRKVSPYSPALRSLASTHAFEQSRSVSDWSQSLSFASPESDFCQGIENVRAPTPIPTSFAEALLVKDTAVVVTTLDSPHRMVHVNSAWEELCGYPKGEAIHGTLGMIQGPDTNVSLLRNMVEELRSTHEPQEAYVVNYAGGTEPFVNHVRAGYMQEPNGVEYFVGLLERVERAPLARSRHMAL